jgi:hypothetical protein
LPIREEVERRLSLHLLVDQPVKRAAAGDNVLNGASAVSSGKASAAAQSCARGVYLFSVVFSL